MRVAARRRDPTNGFGEARNRARLLLEQTRAGDRDAIAVLADTLMYTDAPELGEDLALALEGRAVIPLGDRGKPVASEDRQRNLDVVLERIDEDLGWSSRASRQAVHDESRERAHQELRVNTTRYTRAAQADRYAALQAAVLTLTVPGRLEERLDWLFRGHFGQGMQLIAQDIARTEPREAAPGLLLDLLLATENGLPMAQVGILRGSLSADVQTESIALARMALADMGVVALAPTPKRRRSRRDHTQHVTQCDCAFAARDEASFSVRDPRRGGRSMPVMSDPELTTRARYLLKKYLPGIAPPASIQWSMRMQCTPTRAKWGVCVPSQRAIRISVRLKELPTWVRDSVIVHELAHLKEPNHSKRFWALANRYPGTAKEKQFLRQYMRSLEGDARDAGITVRARPSAGWSSSEVAAPAKRPPAPPKPTGLVVGAVVLFGRPRGEQTRARVVSIGPKAAMVSLLERRGGGRGGVVGSRWRVPFRYLQRD